MSYGSVVFLAASAFLVLVAVFLLGRLSSVVFDSHIFLNSLSLFTGCDVTFPGSIFSGSNSGRLEASGCRWWWLGGCLLVRVVVGGSGGCESWGSGAVMMTLLGIFNPAHSATL